MNTCGIAGPYLNSLKQTFKQTKKQKQKTKTVTEEYTETYLNINATAFDIHIHKCIYIYIFK